MDRDKFLESIRRRVRDATSLEDIEAIFKDAFGLVDDNSVIFTEILDGIQKGDYPVFTTEFAQYLENLDIQTAIEQVGRYFRAAFPAWRENPQGNIPLLILDRKIGEEIGAKTQIVLLSAATFKKQEDHHPELTQEDYEKAQEAVLNGEKIRQDSRNLAFVSAMPEGSLVIVKATFNGQELYVTSLRRVSRDRAKREEETNRLKRRKNW